MTVFCRLKTQNRIVNGQISTENFLPWIVSLAERDYHFCGCSIMNEKYILTAAHCIGEKKSGDIQVRVGIHNKEEKIPKGQIYKVKKIHMHNYINVTVPGDIAILELKDNIKFVDGKIEKGCFNLQERNYPHKFLAAGWGRPEKSYWDSEKKTMVLNGKTDLLKHAFFEQVSNCAEFSICMEPIEKGDSVCQGDSGGPLHYTEYGNTKIEGVSSYVTGRPDKNNIMTYCIGESTYSRLSYYADWISEIADFNFCGSGPKTEPKYKHPESEKKFFGFF